MTGEAMTEEIQKNVGKMLTVQDVQRHLGLGRNVTYQLIHMDSFPKIKIGNSYRIPEKAYIQWIDKYTKKEILL
jgi:excisionase family DNA binding protein